MAKKQRSAAQKRNDKRLGRAAKARAKGPKARKTPKRKAAKRKTPKRKAAKRKTNKQKKTPKRQMAGKKNFISKTLGNPTLKKVLLAAGAVSVATSVAAIVSPSLVPTLQRPIVKAALGFAAGDIVGGASQFLLSGGIGSIQNGNGGSSNAGFA